MTDTICGRDFKIVEPDKPGKLPAYSRAGKPSARFLVDGINHPKGMPIRFKSRANAERHIRNLRLEIAGAA